MNHVCPHSSAPMESLTWRGQTHVAQEDEAIKEADVQTRTRCTLNALVYLLEEACELNYPQTKDSVKLFF